MVCFQGNSSKLQKYLMEVTAHKAIKDPPQSAVQTTCPQPFSSPLSPPHILILMPIPLPSAPPPHPHHNNISY